MQQPVMNTASPSPPAPYQTYDMTGARPVNAPRATRPSSGQVSAHCLLGFFMLDFWSTFEWCVVLYKLI